MISMQGSPGSLYNAWGKLGKSIAELTDYQNAQLTNFTNTTTGVVAQFNTESDIQAIMGNSYISLLDAGGGGVGSVMSQIAAAYANRLVFRDNPQLGQTLTQGNTLASLQEIIRQMGQAGASVLAMTISSTATLFTANVLNIGNGVIVASTKRALDGRVMENTFAETVAVTCVSDSYLNNTTAGNEGFSATGEGAQSNYFAFDWPLGSNCSASLNAIDGNTSNGSGNLLTNSSFAAWTANVPDNWALTTGTGGTHIAQETGLTFGAASCLRIIGDGSNATALRQQFDSSTGTTDALESLTQYPVNVWVRRDGTAPAVGALIIELVDAGGVVVLDANNVPNTFTVDLTATTTQFVAYNAAFRTPHVMPSAVYLRLRLATFLTNGRSVYVACLGFGEGMTQLYTSGPSIAVFAGDEPFGNGDRSVVNFTNSRGAGGTLSTFQTLIARLMPGEVYGNELLLLSSSTPTISDTLISS